MRNPAALGDNKFQLRFQKFQVNGFPESIFVPR
jgi:hypothetical protein